MSRVRALLLVGAGAAFAACASAGVSGGDDQPGTDAPAVDAPPGVDGAPGLDGPPVDAAPTPVMLGQTTSMMVGSNNSIACGNADGTTAENSYYRVFRLADAGITGGLRVTSVTFGVQEALGQPAVQVKVGTYAGNVVPPPAQLDTGLVTPIASATFNVPDTQSTAATTVTVPIIANVPALSQLIVEVLSPDQNGLSKYFYLGGNSAGESKPAYLRAPATGCAVPQPRTVASIGFPDSHLVIAVSGTH